MLVKDEKTFPRCHLASRFDPCPLRSACTLPNRNASKGTFPDCCCQSHIPVVSPCQPTPPQETRQHWQVFWFSLLWSHCSFPLSLGVRRFCLYSPRLRSLLPPVPWKSLIKSCWPPSQIPWGFPVPLSGPQAGKPDMEFQTFTTVGELLWYYCSPLLGHPPGR